jgi:hypothetical protein
MIMGGDHQRLSHRPRGRATWRESRDHPCRATWFTGKGHGRNYAHLSWFRHNIPNCPPSNLVQLGIGAGRYLPA